jgi:nitrogen fixation protein NifU and related proteins
MAYSEKAIDHYSHPWNVGSLPKDDPNVGTGLVGAPECGDVMKVQMKINPETPVIEEAKLDNGSAELGRPASRRPRRNRVWL